MSSTRMSIRGRFVGTVTAGILAFGTPLAMAGTANAAPAPAPATVSSAAVAPAAKVTPTQSVSTSTWDRLAKCESGGKWTTNTGNGFSGGLQFTPSTWKAYGGKGNPHKASKAEQIRVAEKVLKGQGWKAWPACSKKLGLR